MRCTNASTTGSHLLPLRRSEHEFLGATAARARQDALCAAPRARLLGHNLRNEKRGETERVAGDAASWSEFVPHLGCVAIATPDARHRIVFSVRSSACNVTVSAIRAGHSHPQTSQIASRRCSPSSSPSSPSQPPAGSPGFLRCCTRSNRRPLSPGTGRSAVGCRSGEGGGLSVNGRTTVREVITQSPVSRRRSEHASRHALMTQARG